jgi:hypothetical protein
VVKILVYIVHCKLVLLVYIVHCKLVLLVYIVHCKLVCKLVFLPQTVTP